MNNTQLLAVVLVHCACSVHTSEFQIQLVSTIEILFTHWLALDKMRRHDHCTVDKDSFGRNEKTWISSLYWFRIVIKTHGINRIIIIITRIIVIIAKKNNETAHCNVGMHVIHSVSICDLVASLFFALPFHFNNDIANSYDSQLLLWTKTSWLEALSWNWTDS